MASSIARLSPSRLSIAVVSADACPGPEEGPAAATTRSVTSRGMSRLFFISASNVGALRALVYRRFQALHTLCSRPGGPVGLVAPPSSSVASGAAPERHTDRRTLPAGTLRALGGLRAGECPRGLALPSLARAS